MLCILGSDISYFRQTTYLKHYCCPTGYFCH